MPDVTGKDIGRYHLTAPLGEGGMASVYRAYDSHLDTEVAVKFIRPEAFPPEILGQIMKRFEREARVLARLNHAAIVDVLDYGEFEGVPFLVMRYIPGGTVKDRLGTPMPYREAAQLLLPVARALDYAHQRGILHRDVKPTNILITETGDPVLTDFGIARMMDAGEGQTLTATGVGIGTPEYMAPEQGLGNPVDARADVYALGVVLYELVTGRRPYEAPTPMAVMLKHVTDPLPRPRDFVDGLPLQVERVITKALAKDPNDRYAGMDEFADTLEKIVLGEIPNYDAYMVEPHEPTTAPVLPPEPEYAPTLLPQSAAAQPAAAVEAPVSRPVTGPLSRKTPVFDSSADHTPTGPRPAFDEAPEPRKAGLSTAQFLILLAVVVAAALVVYLLLR